MSSVNESTPAIPFILNIFYEFSLSTLYYKYKLYERSKNLIQIQEQNLTIINYFYDSLIDDKLVRAIQVILSHVMF